MKSILIFALVIFAASAFTLSDLTDYLYETVEVKGTFVSDLEKLSETEFAKLDGIVKSTPHPTKSFNPFEVQDCTTQLAIECAFDIEKTVVACAAAFESGGANIIADLKCTKDLLADKKTCWPCICFEAKKKGWNIIGC